MTALIVILVVAIAFLLGYRLGGALYVAAIRIIFEEDQYSEFRDECRQKAKRHRIDSDDEWNRCKNIIWQEIKSRSI